MSGALLYRSTGVAAVLCALGGSAAFATSARADSVLTLKATYIDILKNKATVEVDFTVDKAHKKPNPADKDGDLHAAGHSEAIGLATVAEIENARDVPHAVDRIHSAEASGQSVKIT